MIIDVPATATRRELRVALLRAAEAIKPKATFKRTKRVAGLEKARMREKVTATNALDGKLKAAIAQWQTDFFKAAKVLKKESREADGDNSDAEDQALSDQQRKDLLDAVGAISADPITDALVSVAGGMYDSGTAHAAADIHTTDDDGLLTLDNTRAKDALNTRYIEFATDVTDDQQDAIKDLLTQAFDDNISTADITSSIADLFKDGVTRAMADGSTRTYDTDSWSNMVARTEVSYAQNSGIVDYYREAGIEKLQWVAAGDACDECAELDGEIADIDGNFKGTDVTQPPEHPRCRCTVIAAGDADGDTGDADTGDDATTSNDDSDSSEDDS